MPEDTVPRELQPGGCMGGCKMNIIVLGGVGPSSGRVRFPECINSEEYIILCNILEDNNALFLYNHKLYLVIISIL